MPFPSRAALCWVVTDGRAGTENQALGLAEAVARLTPIEIAVKRIAVKAPWRFLPRMLWSEPFHLLSPRGALLRPPYPDLWIGCGRVSTRFTAEAKRLRPEMVAVQIQAPRMALSHFDLVVPPQHDGLSGDTVSPIIGAPSRVTRARLEQEAAQLESAMAHVPRPRVAVLLGGPNRAYKISRARRSEIAFALRRLAQSGAGLMVTASRRTPALLNDAVAEALHDMPHFIWNGEPVAGLDNPYFGLLGLAEHIVVTADSVNMATEAAMTGRPVHIVRLDKRPLASSAKFRRFHKSLEKAGASRRFILPLQEWSYVPLDETARAAAEVLKRMAMR